MDGQGEISLLLYGRDVTQTELEYIKEMGNLFPQLSRTELARTICEHLGWKTKSGKDKVDACRKILEHLDRNDDIDLIPKRKQRRSGDKKIQVGSSTDPGSTVSGSVHDVQPVRLRLVNDRKEMGLWNEYIERYHYLGYKRPFGEHQRYFITAGDGQYLGCLAFAAAAWRVTVRDEWIGWSEADRSRSLYRVLNNNRFLIFPWVRVRNLASKVLSLAAKRIRDDWQQRYNHSPVLLETFVDPRHFLGTCYKAANWLDLGETAGTGRTDRHNRCSGKKRIYVYSLVADFRTYLC